MNRIEEAKEVFAAIYEVPMESPEVLSNVRDIQLSLELAHNVSLGNLVKMGKPSVHVVYPDVPQCHLSKCVLRFVQLACHVTSARGGLQHLIPMVEYTIC